MRIYTIRLQKIIKDPFFHARLLYRRIKNTLNFKREGPVPSLFGIFGLGTYIPSSYDHLVNDNGSVEILRLPMIFSCFVGSFVGSFKTTPKEPKYMANQPTPPYVPPPRNKALLRAY